MQIINVLRYNVHIKIFSNSAKPMLRRNSGAPLPHLSCAHYKIPAPVAGCVSCTRRSHIFNVVTFPQNHRYREKVLSPLSALYLRRLIQLFSF
jgi:hypothetical protein